MRAGIKQALILLVLNLIDAGSTHVGLSMRVAEEVNPVMRWAWEISPATFWVVKFGVLALILLYLAWQAPDKYMYRILLWMNVAYVLVLLIHCIGWVRYFIS